MSFRTDRRRRLLGDDSMTAEPEDEGGLRTRDSAAAGNQPVQRAYSIAAQAALNRPVREFFPSRLAMMALTSVVGLALVGLLELAHVWSARLAELLGAGEASVFDLSRTGNASGGLAGLILAAAGMVAMFIYTLRRHRVDDYHGRYRVWIATAIGCLLVGLGETTSAFALVRELGRRAAESSGLDETIVWPASLAALTALVGIRLLLEMWRCRWAVALLMLTAGGFAVAAAVNHAWLTLDSDLERQLIERGTWLTGYLLLVITFLTYARHVTAEIEGRVAVVPAQPRKRKVKPAPAAVPEQPRSESQRRTGHIVRTDLDTVASPVPAAHTAPPRQQPSPNAANRPAAISTSTNHGASGSSQGNRQLSRAERRRLRREAA